MFPSMNFSYNIYENVFLPPPPSPLLPPPPSPSTKSQAAEIVNLAPILRNRRKNF